MFPPLVPVGLGEFTPDAVDGFDGCGGVDGVHVGGDADDGAVFPVEGDVVGFEVAEANAVEVP